MLILSRFVDEVITIGDDIEIMIVSIEGIGGDRPKVHLGINAPRSLQVHRKEVYKRIQRENSRR